MKRENGTGRRRAEEPETVKDQKNAPHDLTQERKSRTAAGKKENDND